MIMGSESWCRYLMDGAGRLGIRVTAEQVTQMAVHAKELLQWNRRMNLTAVIDPREMAEKHYLDALAAVTVLPEDARVLDLGTGPGFPGIPLKIVCPALDMTLVDAARKKVTFLNHVIRRLDMPGISAHHVRVDDRVSPIPTLRHDRFTIIISRAVMSLDRLVSMVLPLLDGNGMIVAMKGTARRTESEIRDLHAFTSPERAALLATMHQVHYRLPYTGSQRSLVCLSRTAGDTEPA